MSTLRGYLSIGIFVAIIFLCNFSVSFAATIYTNSSTGNDSTGDGTSGAPYATFHKAYTSASGGDTIDLTGTFTWSDAAETGDASTSGYTIAKDLTIQGQGSDQTFIQAASAASTADRRVFTISAGVTASISKVNIRYGRITSSSYYGGGISNSGTLTITDSEIDNNYCGGGGGGIDNVGTTTARRISVYNNTVYYMGGGLLNDYYATGYFVVENSTIYNNYQTSTSGYLNGAGVHVRGGDMYLTNNTITGNVAKGGGGLGMETTGTVYLMNNIIAGNTSQTYGATYNDLRKSSGTITDNGYNIIGRTGGVSFTGTGDWTDTDGDSTYTLYSVGTTGSLNLDTGVSVNDNATSTPTWAILADSIAINAGSTGANGTYSSAPDWDQRSATRSGATDIGSFEYGGGGLTIAAPTTQATAVTFSSVEYNRMTVAWTAGSGSRRTVFMKAASSGTASPVDGTAYTASTVFGSGTEIGSSGWYTIYDGVSSSGSITITGLTQGVTYSVQVFEYNGVALGASTYQTATASGNPGTQQTHAVVTVYANSSTGDDSTGDGTSGSPYATFYKVYTSASAGDTLDLTGTFTWTDADETGDASVSGYTIDKDIIIQGQGSDTTILQTATASTTATSRVFTIASTASTTITNLTIQNGRTTSSSQYGGGIANSGTLTLRHVDISNNNGAGSGGGGLSNYGTAVIENCSISNNSGYYMGGGIVNIASSATMAITNSTIYGNRQVSSVAYTEGGGVNIRYGTVTITNSTIAYNSSYSAGGGIYLDDPTGVLYMENTIVANNTQRSGSSGSDFGKYSSATMNDNGYNIVGRSSGFTFSATGDWTDTDNNGTWSGVGGGSGSLYLDTSLALNANPYKTYTLALTDATSIAVNNASASSNNGVSIPTTDQRVATRSGAADIGAYEYDGGGLDSTAPSVSLTAPTDGASVSGASVSLTASASDDVAVAGVSFYVNGVLQGSEDTSSSYGITWNSTATSSGSKTIVAVARDTANNRATSTAITVTVANEPAPASVSASTATTTAALTWTTPSEGSSRVFFGLVSSTASSTAEENTSTRVTSHSVSLVGLPACTTFKYLTVSTNAGSDTATSSLATFTTAGCTGSASISAHNEDTITTAAGGSITQGNLTLTVPTSFTATSSSAVFQISALDNTAFVASAGSPTGVTRAGSNVFHLGAYTDESTSLSSFDSGLSVTISYSNSDVSSLDESSLTIYRYDGSSWTALSGCSVNTTAHTVTCSTTHFSDFAIFGQQSSSSSQDATPASSSAIVAGGVIFGCTDPQALNYSPYALGSDGSCQYSVAKPTAIVATPTLAESIKIKDTDFARDLWRGLLGEDVRMLQMFLNKNGFVVAEKGDGSLGNESDYFGPATQKALVAFQLANDITPAVGYFGSVTREFITRGIVIFNTNQSDTQVSDSILSRDTTSVFYRDLEQGMAGDDVLLLQQWLNTHGFVVAEEGEGSLGNETTYFGPATKQALIDFQNAHNIVPALGYFGPITRAAIESL